MLIGGGIGMMWYTTQVKNPMKTTPASGKYKQPNSLGNTSTHNAEQKVITAYGDSLTAGYNLPIEQSYPSLLEKKLQEEGYNYRVVNAGVSGDTSSAALSRIDWVLQSKPQIVILTLGANDAFRGIDPNITKENLSKIIETLQAENITILLGGMYAPRNLGTTYYQEFDAIYQELAQKYNIELIPFFLEGVVLKQEYNLEDGIHPNEEGYKIVVENNIWPKLEGMLEK